MKKRIIASILALSMMLSTGLTYPIQAKEEKEIKNVTMTEATEESITIQWDAFKKEESDTSEYLYQIWTAPVISATPSAITISGLSIEATPQEEETAGKWTANMQTYATKATINYGKGMDCYVRVYTYTKDIPRHLVTPTAKAIRVGTKTAPAKKPTIKEITETSIKIQWEAVANADKYKVYGKAKTDGAYNELIEVNTPEALVTGLQADTTYQYYVVAINQTGTIEIPNTKSSRTPVEVTTLSNAPTGFNLKSNWTWNQGVYLTWNDTKNNGYEIEVSDADTGNHTAIYPTEESHYTLTSFATRRWQKVRARGYQILGTQKIYTQWTPYQYINKQTKVSTIKQTYKTIKKKVKTKKGKKWKKVKSYQAQAKVTWKPTEGTTSYDIYVSSKPNSGYKKQYTTTKTAVTIKKYGAKKLKKGKKYYVRMISKKQVDGTVNTSFETGTYKSIKLKK